MGCFEKVLPRLAAFLFLFAHGSWPQEQTFLLERWLNVDFLALWNRDLNSLAPQLQGETVVFIPTKPIQHPTEAHKRCSLSSSLVPAAEIALPTQHPLRWPSAPRGWGFPSADPFSSPRCWGDVAAATVPLPPPTPPQHTHTLSTEVLVKSTKLPECPGKWEWAGLTQGWFETSLVAF